MNIKKMSKEDLELMSYTDIAYYLLKEKTNQSTIDLFKEECELLKLPKKAYEDKIGDFYTSLVTDKRFILLDTGNWDLKENHSIKALKIEEALSDMEEIDVEDSFDNLEEDDEEKEVEYEENPDDDPEDVTEEYKNLVIIDEDELEQNNNL